MLEYFINNYFLLLYFLAFILSLAKYRLYYDTVLKHLPIIIVYTLLSEILGLIVRDVNEIQIVYKEDYHNYNTVIFNIFDIVYYLYFLYVYRKTIDTPINRTIINYGSVLFIVACVLNLFVQNFLTEPQSFAIIVGSLFLVYAAITYLIKTNRKKQKIPQHKNLLFWISIGTLLFYTIYPFTMYILSFEYKFFTAYNLSIFHLVMIGVLYTCYILGFVFMTRFRKFD